jgi:superfamily II DNA helicase RecQ
MAQLQAGYAIEEVTRFLSSPQFQHPIPASKVRAMLHHLSWFEVDSSVPFDGPGIEHDNEALWCVAANLVSRGLPTRAPITLAEELLRRYWPQGAEKDEAAFEKGTYTFSLADSAKPELWAKWLWRALHPVDPRLKADATVLSKLQSWESHGSDFERRFLTQIIPAIDGAYLMQLIQPQTSLRNLLEWAPDEAEQLHKLLQTNPEDFTDQSVDFTLPLPYPWHRNNLEINPPVRGIILEVDGSQHWEDDSQRRKDASRDKAAQDANWLPLRLRTNEFSHSDKPLAGLHEATNQHEYFQLVRSNYERSLLTTEAGRAALMLTLGPLAAGRIHRTLLECMLNGLLPAHKPAWRIAILERDIPCGVWGVSCLVEQMNQLYCLQGLGRALPAIELHVVPSPEFERASPLATADFRLVTLDTATLLGDDYDVLLDVSVLQRPGFSQTLALKRTPCVTVRTAHAPQQARRFHTAPLIPYPPVVERDGSSESAYTVPEEQQVREKALEYFVQNIFRKKGLRLGQLPIISRGLQGKSVLGLLPTGGGKSLTYQLAALLQPGVALVVDPIKSLMLDQYDGLHDNWIDAASYVNGSVRSRVQRELRLARLRRGELLFFFISPERMVIPDFRQKLQDMHRLEPKVGFSYCVIDEAHCVSEWGHDFRTPYLRLGANARTYCHTYDGGPLPLYGLTATASFDVLADVQRELNLENEDEAIVRTEVSARQELHVRIVPIHVQNPLAFDAAGPAKHQALLDLLPNVPHDLSRWNGQSAIGLEEGTALTVREVANLEPDTFYMPNSLGQYDHAGLIFCPHKSPKISTGVRHVVYALNEPGQGLPHLKTGYFMGGSADDGDTSEQSQQRELVSMDRMQTQFKANELNLLVATKAFGMGIDKPNVRFTVHYCYPSSIESFVQEAGRAGRDRATAVNYVLYYKEDEEIQQNFLANAFKGKLKESCMMHELLTQISFPTAEQCETLNAELEAAFPDLPVSANLYTPPGASIPRYLYLNQAHSCGYGRVDLTKPRELQGDFKNKHVDIPSIQAQRVVNWVINYLLTEVPDEACASQRALAKELSGSSVTASIPGIIPRLEAIAFGISPEPLTIGFTNGTLREMHEAAGTFNLELPIPLLRKASSYAHTAEKFLSNLQKAYKKSYSKTLHLPAELRDLIRELVPHMRKEEDTFKAVHRLCLLGVISDYTIDYGARSVMLYFAPRQTDEQILEAYRKYLLRYTTPPNANGRIVAVQEAANGINILAACLDNLLDFTYTETAAKRQESIRAMGNACEMGLNGENLSEYFDLYFNSKYAREEYLPKDTQKGRYFDQEILWRYVNYLGNPPDNLGKEKDNAKHLRGACNRLLQDRIYSSNGVVLLLSGFTTLFLELSKPEDKQAQRLLEEGQNHLLTGFRAYQEQDALSLPDLLKFAQQFAFTVGQYDNRLAAYINTHITGQLELEVLTGWLQEFNHRFDDRPVQAVIS